MSPSSTTKGHKKIFLLLLAALSLGAILHAQLPAPDEWSQRPLELQFHAKDVLSSDLLALSALGHQGMLADLMLIRTLLAFGELEFQHDRLIDRIPWFHRVLDSVTDLDNEFRSAYMLGGGILALRDTQDYRLANKFLKEVAFKKWKDWHVPAWIGFNYYFIKDYDAYRTVVCHGSGARRTYRLQQLFISNFKEGFDSGRYFSDTSAEGLFTNGRRRGYPSLF